MDPSPSSDERPDDVLSIGEGRTPRWVRLGAVLVVLLLGFGAYRLLSPPSSPTAPEPAEAAERPRVFPTAGRVPGTEPGGPDVELRLGGLMVTLRGRGL